MSAQFRGKAKGTIRTTGGARAAEERMERILALADDVRDEANQLDHEVEQLREVVDQVAHPGDVDERPSRLAFDGAAAGGAAYGESSQAIRVVASQLLATGCSKEECEARLASDFDVVDPSAVIEELRECRRFGHRRRAPTR